MPHTIARRGAPLTVSVSEFAELCGINRRTVSRLVAAGVLRLERGRRLALGPSVRAYAAYVARGREATAENALRRGALYGERLRGLRLANDRREAELISAQDVQAVIAVAQAEMLGPWGGLPERLTEELACLTDPARVNRRLRAEVMAIRAAVADRLSRVAIASQGQRRR